MKAALILGGIALLAWLVYELAAMQGADQGAALPSNLSDYGTPIDLGPGITGTYVGVEKPDPVLLRKLGLSTPVTWDTSNVDLSDMGIETPLASGRYGG